MGGRGGRRRRRGIAARLARRSRRTSARRGSDAVLFALRLSRGRGGRLGALDEVNELAVALAGSAERRLETTAQGARVSAARCAPPGPARRSSRCRARGRAGRLSGRGRRRGGRHGMALDRAAAGLRRQPHSPISSRRRCGSASIGQTDGQKISGRNLARLRGAWRARRRRARLDDLGACAFRSDIAAMRHETQYSRLFRS